MDSRMKVNIDTATTKTIANIIYITTGEIESMLRQLMNFVVTHWMQMA